MTSIPTASTCFFRLFLLCGLLMQATYSSAATDPILDTAEQHVRLQTQALPGKVSLRFGKIDTQRLAPCQVLEAYSPPGIRWIGKSTVGVRCLSPQSWQVLIPVDIAVYGQYLTTTRPLASGQVIQAGDIHVVSGDVSTLPTGIVNDPAAAIGKSLKNAIAAGLPLRTEQLIAPLLIRQGQVVRVVSKGDGFAVSAEGKAMTHATEGQSVQIRMPSGQTITGKTRADGIVEVAN